MSPKASTKKKISSKKKATPSKRRPVKKKQATTSAPKKRAKKAAPRKSENAESMAKRQRDISVSEFFSKNRHLLGFDNPRKALLTAVKEAVDNSLDACEEAGILPTIHVRLKRISAKIEEPADDENEDKPKKKRRGPSPVEKFVLSIADNGPGIVAPQIPKIFAKLLYGSKFHRLKMSRGQQGIGISAAGMYGQMTTGVPVKITSKLPKKDKAQYVELSIDTKANKPTIHTQKEVAWKEKSDCGTVVEICLEGRYQRGKTSIDEFIKQNTLSNPHAEFLFTDPDGEVFEYKRGTEELPPLPDEIKPHPYGVELGNFHRLFADTKARTLKGFLMKDFSRVSDKVATDILKEAGIKKDIPIKKVSPDQLNDVHAAVPKIAIMNPPTDCVVPIGDELVMETLQKMTNADFYTGTTRSPSVYRGNPFIVEVALAYGGELSADDQVTVYRFANRVPLLFQPGACATTRVIQKADWKKYGLSQSRGALPVGPVAVLVHVASVWVPFTSESKEAIADYPEIKQEIRLALLDCARKLSIHLSKKRKAAEAARKANYIDTYIPYVGEALQEMLKLSDKEKDRVVNELRGTLERARTQA